MPCNISIDNQIVASGITSTDPPVVAGSSSGLLAMVVFVANDGSNDVIQASFSTDRGLSWNTPFTLSAAGQNARSPSISGIADGSRFTAIWIRNDGTNDVVQVRTFSSGVWGSIQTLSDNGQPAVGFPKVASSSSGAVAQCGPGSMAPIILSKRL